MYIYEQVHVCRYVCLCVMFLYVFVYVCVYLCVYVYIFGSYICLIFGNDALSGNYCCYYHFFFSSRQITCQRNCLFTDDVLWPRQLSCVVLPYPVP